MGILLILEVLFYINYLSNDIELLLDGNYLNYPY